MPRPTPLESSLIKWVRFSSFGDFVRCVSDQIGVLRAEKGLVSRIEVGLRRDSFEAKPVNSLGELKIDEVGLLYLSVGDGKEPPKSAIRARFNGFSEMIWDGS